MQWQPNQSNQETQRTIKRFNTKQGGTVGGFTVPRHRHNGSDMLKVQMGDLAADVRGLQFSTPQGFININAASISNTTALLTIENNDGQGNDNLITLSPTTASIRISNKANNNANYIIADDSMTITSILPWLMKFPVNLTLPLTPIIGEVCFYSADGGTTGHLQVCESAGVWTAL